MARPGSVSDRSAPPDASLHPGDAAAGQPSDVLALDRTVDLASLEAAQDEKRRLLDRAAAAARELAAGPGEGPADTPTLLHRYYAGEPAAEVVGHEPADLARLALDHLQLAARRAPGAALVDVHRPTAGRAVLRVVTDDMPHLVDSVTAEVVRQGVTLDHVVHPVVVVRRDAQGALLAFCDSADAESCGADALAESWMAVVLGGPVDDEAAEDLVEGLGRVLADVRLSHQDARALHDRAAEVAAVLDRLPLAGDGDHPAEDPAEAAAFLRWLAAGNFLFLGARTVE